LINTNSQNPKKKNTLFVGKKKTPGGKPFVSLRLKFAAVLVGCATVTILLALLLIPLVLNLVMTHYTHPERVDHRLEDYIHSFADYVMDQEVKSDDVASVVKWTKRHRYVHLVVFEGEKAQFGVVGGEVLEGDQPPVMDPIFTDTVWDDDASDAVIGKIYNVTFADRNCLVSVVDYSASMVYEMTLIGGIILAAACFFVVMILYYHKQIKAIVSLSEAVERMSGGELTTHIKGTRNDEIGNLARDVDTMRATIIQKMDEEREAWDVNSELITSMSHDIRTPLTTLLGYMELLSADTQNLTDEQKAYIQVCADKAEQIKGLSDKLFLYFWAYHRNEDEVPLQSLPAGLLLEQMLGEWLLPMESENVTVDISLQALSPETNIMVNVDCLRRVMDNLFDNIRKYADRAYPVCVLADLRWENGRPREVMLSFENRVGVPKEGSSGTHVGHRTCRNMLELMGGRFEIKQEEKVFVAIIGLPVSC